MPKTAAEVFRDFVRYTGDGLPNEPINAPLPHGDPSSGVWNPPKRDIREAMGDTIRDAQIAQAAAAEASGAVATFSTPAAMLADSRAWPNGSVILTRADGYAYEAVTSGEDFTTAGGIKLRVMPQRGMLDVRAFGAKLDGTTNDAAAFQKCCTAASTRGWGVYIPGGSLAFDGTVTLDLSAASESDELKPGLIGAGSGVTEIKGLSASAVLNVIGNNASGAGGHGHATIRGIKFSGAGTGLNVERLAYMSYEDLFFLAKTDGMIMTDVLSSRMWNCRFRWGQRHLTMNANVSFSRPNALSLYGCHFGQAAEYGLRNIGGANLAMYGGSVEKCGLTGASGREGGIRVEDAGVEGEMALDVRGVYFEGNKGEADIAILQGASRALYNVAACSFNRIHATNRTTNNILLVTSTGDLPARLMVQGCAFGDFNGYVPTASERYIRVLDPAGVADLVTSGNTYETLAAWPNAATGEAFMAASFDGTAATPAADGARNVASITKTGTGRYQITLRRPVPQDHRSVAVSINGAGFGYLFAQTDTSITINTDNTSGAAADFGKVSVLLTR